MRAGLLDKQISIMQPTATARSTDGAPVIVWSTYLGNIWAQVINHRGDEQYRDRRRWEVDETDFITYWTTHVIENNYRVRYNNDDYEIKAVINENEDDKVIKIITVLHK